MNTVNFPVELKLPVLWGDQDMFRHVNNTIHLKWFESSRVAYWENTGMRRLMEPLHLAPILASVTCHYRHQIRYPDTVTVAARAVRIGRTSLTLAHQIVSAERKLVAADGESVIVIFNYESQQPQEISAELRQVIEAAEGRAISPGTR